MTFLPIVERELRLKARRSQTYFNRCGLVVAFAVLSFGIITIDWSAGQNPMVIGEHLFWGLSGLGFAAALLAGPIITADCLSEEKREGTLGLLFLTRLKGFDVVLGKLVATSLPIFYSFVAGIPVLAIPFFLGGVTAGEFWRMTLVLLTTLLFSLVTGLFVSAISRNGRRAFLATGLIVSLFTISPLLSGYLLEGKLSVSFSPLPNPGHPFTLAADGRYSAAAGDFWRSWTALVTSSAGLLAMASMLLPRTWIEQRHGGNACRWPARSEFGRRMTSTKGTRKRTRLLAKNPVLWLAERTSLSPVAIGVFWSACLGLWIFGFSEMRKNYVPAEALFVTIYVLHGAVKCWVAWEASRRFAEDRRSGALELLLVTPLTERAVLVGWLIGLKRRFAGPIAVVLSLDILLWWSGTGGAWLLVMLVASGLFVADCYTLCWIGLWKGLTAKNSTQACVRTIGQVLVFPWFAAFGVWAVVELLTREGSLSLYSGWFVVVWFLTGYVLDFGFCLWGISRLSRDLRPAAAYPLGTRRAGKQGWLIRLRRAKKPPDDRMQSAMT
jgi:ABC-type transport system involved in cytochrome c biogenesis permease component